MVEGDEIAQDDSEVANILGDFFSNSVRGLNLEIPSEYKNEVFPLLDDPIDKIIATYSDHPSIKLIEDNVVKGNFSFEEVNVATIRKQIMSLDDTKAFMSSSIPPREGMCKVVSGVGWVVGLGLGGGIFTFALMSFAFYLYFYFCFYFSFTSTYISYYFIHFFTFIYLVVYILGTFF